MSTTTAAKSKPVRKSQPAAPVAESSEKIEGKPAKVEAKPISSEFIGEAAGTIWGILNADGPQTLAQLKKAVDAPADTVLAAVGWLAREGKLNFDTSAKAVAISLV